MCEWQLMCQSVQMTDFMCNNRIWRRRRPEWTISDYTWLFFIFRHWISWQMTVYSPDAGERQPVPHPVSMSASDSSVWQIVKRQPCKTDDAEIPAGISRIRCSLLQTGTLPVSAAWSPLFCRLIKSIRLRLWQHFLLCRRVILPEGFTLQGDVSCKVKPRITYNSSGFIYQFPRRRAIVRIKLKSCGIPPCMAGRGYIWFSGNYYGYPPAHGYPVCRIICGEDRKDKRILPETAAGAARLSTASGMIWLSSGCHNKKWKITMYDPALFVLVSGGQLQTAYNCWVLRKN